MSWNEQPCERKCATMNVVLWPTRATNRLSNCTSAADYQLHVLLQLRSEASVRTKVKELIVEWNELNVPDSDATSISLSAKADQLSLSCRGGRQGASLQVKAGSVVDLLAPET